MGFQCLPPGGHPSQRRFGSASRPVCTALSACVRRWSALPGGCLRSKAIDLPRFLRTNAQGNPPRRAPHRDTELWRPAPVATLPTRGARAPPVSPPNPGRADIFDARNLDVHPVRWHMSPRGGQPTLAETRNACLPAAGFHHRHASSTTAPNLQQSTKKGEEPETERCCGTPPNARRSNSSVERGDPIEHSAGISSPASRIAGVGRQPRAADEHDGEERLRDVSNWASTATPGPGTRELLDPAAVGGWGVRRTSRSSRPGRARRRSGHGGAWTRVRLRRISGRAPSRSPRRRFP